MMVMVMMVMVMMVRRRGDGDNDDDDDDDDDDDNDDDDDDGSVGGGEHEQPVMLPSHHYKYFSFLSTTTHDRKTADTAMRTIAIKPVVATTNVTIVAVTMTMSND